MPCGLSWFSSTSQECFSSILSHHKLLIQAVLWQNQHGQELLITLCFICWQAMWVDQWNSFLFSASFWYLGFVSKEMLDFVHAILSLSKFHLKKKKTILVYVMSNASVTIYYENCCDSKILFSNLHYYRIKFDFFFPFNFEKFHHGPPIIFIPFSK